jgi:predicted extracellular nuclease
VSNYTKATDFEAKDSLPSGDPDKVVKGSEIEDEFDAISTAIATKADTASPTFTGTVVVPTPFTIGATSMTSTATELNVLDGITATTAELNIMDGVTATAAELNILDGVTSTAAELNILDGVTSTAAELNVLDGVTAFIDDDTMATASATNIPSAESVKAYADAAQTSAVPGAVTITTSASSQAITGIGFQPSFVEIHVTASGSDWIAHSHGYGNGSANECAHAAIEGGSGTGEFSAEYTTFAYNVVNPAVSSSCRGTITIESDGFTIVKGTYAHSAYAMYVCHP